MRSLTQIYTLIPVSSAVITDSELRTLVLHLRRNNFKPDYDVWSESVSTVSYISSDNFALMFSEINKIYDLHAREDL